MLRNPAPAAPTPDVCFCTTAQTVRSFASVPVRSGDASNSAQTTPGFSAGAHFHHLHKELSVGKAQ